MVGDIPKQSSHRHHAKSTFRKSEKIMQTDRRTDRPMGMLVKEEDFGKRNPSFGKQIQAIV